MKRTTRAKNRHRRKEAKVECATQLREMELAEEHRRDEELLGTFSWEDPWDDWWDYDNDYDVETEEDDDPYADISNYELWDDWDDYRSDASVELPHILLEVKHLMRMYDLLTNCEKERICDISGQLTLMVSAAARRLSAPERETP